MKNVARNVVEVNLQGRSFTLGTDEDEAYLLAAADYANRKIEEISGAGPVPPHSAALLAALTMATELMRERQAMDLVRENIRTKSRLILEMLDVAGREIEGDDPPVSEG